MEATSWLRVIVSWLGEQRHGDAILSIVARVIIDKGYSVGWRCGAMVHVIDGGGWCWLMVIGSGQWDVTVLAL